MEKRLAKSCCQFLYSVCGLVAVRSIFWTKDERQVGWQK
jgi:hypothetical protein